MTNQKGAVDYIGLADAMAAAGGDAAVSNAANPGTASASNAQWTMANPQGAVAGILAMRSGTGSGGISMNAYLRRDGSLPMTGSLNMGAMDINNSRNITASGTLQAGTANAGTGTITNLNSTNLISANVTATSSTAQNATVNGTLNAGAVNTGTATVTWANVGTVSAGTVSAGNTSTTNLSAANASVTSENVNSLSANILGTNSLWAGSATTQGRHVMGEYVQLNGTAAVGNGCGPNGLVGQDGSGLILSCINGVWHTPLARTGVRYVFSGYGNVLNAQGGYPDVGFAQCNANEIVIGGGASCQDGTDGWVTDSFPQGNGWVVNCFGHAPGNVNAGQDTPAQAVAVCLTVQ
jgi:hypothetical protein